MLHVQFMLSVLLINNKRLRNEHPGDTDEGNEEEENWEALLESVWSDDCYLSIFNDSSIEGHSNHHGNNWGGLTLSICEVSAPLANDHQVHVSKEHKEEDDLRNELQKEVQLVASVESIWSLHADS